MSYSNPKIYQQDPLAFSKSFEKSFIAGYGAVEEHIADVRKKVQENNKKVQEAGEDMADVVGKSKNLTTTWSNKLAGSGLQWMQDSRFVEQRQDGSAIESVASARVGGGVSMASMQKAEASFKGMSSSVNYIAEFLVDSNKYKNTDKSNKEWADIQLAMDYARENPNALNVSQFDNEFEAEITYPDPNGEWVGEDGRKYSRISTDVLQAKLMTLQDKKIVIDNFDKTVDKFKGAISSDIDKAKKNAMASNQTVFIDAEQQIKEKTEPMLRSMWIAERNNPTGSKGGSYFDQVFANYGDTIPFDFEEGVDVYGQTQKEIFAKSELGASIVKEIESVEDQELRSLLEGSLKAMCDLPLSDSKRIDQYTTILAKSGIINKREIPNLYSALEEYQFQVVKEIHDQNLIAKGVDSAVSLKKRFNPRYSSKTIKEDKKYDSERAGVILREGFSTAIASDKSWENIDGDAGFTSGGIRIGGKGTPKQVVGTSYNSLTGVLSIHYPSGRAIDGVRSTEQINYDTRDPYKMQDMYRDLGNGNTKGFEKEMLTQFDEDGFASLDKLGMDKWVTWLEKKGYKNKMIDHVAENPEVLISYPHWRDFFNKNKKSIDAKMISKAKGNK